MPTPTCANVAEARCFSHDERPWAVQQLIGYVYTTHDRVTSVSNEPTTLTTHNHLGWHHLLGESRQACIDLLRQQLALDVRGTLVARDLTIRLSLSPSYEVRLAMGPRVLCVETDLRDLSTGGVQLHGDGTREQAIEHFLRLAIQDGEHWQPHGKSVL